MNVTIRPAKTSHDCDVVGEIYYQACRSLDWNRLVYPKVAPEDMKRHISQLARIVRKTYHGIVIVAELEGKIVGYLIAWEIGPNCPDPYDDQAMVARPDGKDISMWQNLSSQIDRVWDHVQKDYGPFLYVDEIGVLPESQGCGMGRRLMEYTVKGARVYRLPMMLTAAPEATEFYTKMQFERVDKPVMLTHDGKLQLIPLLLPAVSGETTAREVAFPEIETLDSGSAA